MIVLILKRIAIIVAVLYVGILLVLMANETSLVYPGSKYPRGNWTPTDFEFEEVEFRSADGTRLVGWYLPPPQSDSIAADEDASDEDTPSKPLLRPSCFVMGTERTLLSRPRILAHAPVDAKR